ncbi:hypothetical protein [Chlamydia gallinacea]|uniref:Uncharacterized protein n=2 Tax=Chlamydia gallinacea TaxID=1457153 RepID=A0A173DZJ8_9CHLA|nr:hypothetical protein [Chlamydia gallinacea]EYE61861.1 hypothetical protein M127_4973 [Bacteroides fragilis str. S6L5]ANG66316.1 hypothetical protein M787_003200 [Chlamydia gallinacea 08-1274/3]AQT77480.1 hypothetical protein B1F83_02400 [Chlamydia gallinacea]MBX6679787.1 hypothetical protein [Chlamydia gallinacea]MBX6687717.1 hypothetical protein [Chlamydia gallinacea]
MFIKKIKKLYKVYLKNVINNLVQFLDEILSTLGEYLHSHVSKEEQDRLLSLLIEDIQQYKKSLQETAQADPQTNTNLLK